jgi:hypothetical protein
MTSAIAGTKRGALFGDPLMLQELARPAPDVEGLDAGQ